MLRACVLEFKGSWVKYLSLVEFAYNNSYQTSISMASFGVLYGRKYRTLICWNEMGERKINNLELIEVSTENICIIREKLKVAQDSQKSYVDVRRKELDLEMDDMVILKVAP